MKFNEELIQPREQIYCMTVLPTDKVYAHRTLEATQLAHIGVFLDIVLGYSLIIDMVVNQPDKNNDFSYSFSNYVIDSVSQSVSDSLLSIEDQATGLEFAAAVYLLMKKKYKLVAKKVKPIPGTFPKDFRVERKIIGDPLAGMPELPTHPGEYVPTGRYTKERKDLMDEVHGKDFLWEEELKLLHQFMMLQNL